MIRKLVLVTLSLVAFALPLPSQADNAPPEICEIVWQPRMKADGEKTPPDDHEKGCPKQGAERPWTPYLEEPCEPDAFTDMCMLDP